MLPESVADWKENLGPNRKCVDDEVKVMHLVDTLPVIFVAIVFVSFFGYLLFDAFWGRISSQDKGL